MGHQPKSAMLEAPAGAGPAHAGQGRGRRQARSTCTARAGTSARWPTTPASCRPPSSDMAGTGIGTFNDRLRDAVRGGGPFDENPRIQGFASGLYTDPNGDPVNGTPRAAEGRAAAQPGPDQGRPDRQPARLPVRRPDRRDGDRGRRSTTTAQPTGYTARPAGGDHLRRGARQRDAVRRAGVQAAAVAPSMADRIRMQTLASVDDRARAGRVLLARRRATCCAASRWTATATTPATGSTCSTTATPTNGFGRGLPPRTDNEAKWPYMRPLLADPALDADRGGHPDGQAAGQRAAGDPAEHAAVPPGHRRPGPAEGVVPDRRSGPDARGDRDADRRHRRPGRRPGG